MRTFVYKGPAPSMRVRDAELLKGKPFETEDHRLIEMLTVLVEVEEVKPGEERQSRKKDAERS